MKKKRSLVLGGALTAALILGACGTNESASAEDMEWETKEHNGKVVVQEDEKSELGTTAQEAVDKALKEFDGTVTDVEYDEDDGEYYYQIEIENGNEDFEVKLNADDLSVIEQDLDRDDDQDDRDDDGEDDRDDDNRAATDKTQNAESKGETELKDAFEGNKAAEAITAAQENFDGILESVSYEEDDGEYYYEVKLENEKEEYEVKLNEKDLTVIEEEREDDNNERSFKKLEAAHEEKIISLEEAQKIALEQVDGEVKDWDYDVDDFNYDFEIGDRDVEVDAKTGKVTDLDD